MSTKMKPVEPKAQLGASVPVSVALDVRRDCRDFAKSKDDLVTVILREHFAMKKSARSLLYKRVANKKMGAPLK